MNDIRRVPIIVVTAGIQYGHGVLGDEVGKGVARQRFSFRSQQRVFGSITVLVGQDQFHVAAASHGSIPGQTSDGEKIVGLLSQAVIIKLSDRGVHHAWHFEPIESWATWFMYSGWLVFKPRLIGRDLSRLRRTCLSLENL